MKIRQAVRALLCLLPKITSKLNRPILVSFDTFLRNHKEPSSGEGFSILKPTKSMYFETFYASNLEE